MKEDKTTFYCSINNGDELYRRNITKKTEHHPNYG